MKFNQRITIVELLKLLDNYKFKRFDIHHTWKPNYSNLKTNTPEQLNSNMKNYHIKQGYGDIAQHITTYPDGTILIGRDFSKRPVSIANRNTGAFAMEMVGNFDYFRDIITVEQRQITLELIKYFRPKGVEIAFHRDYSSKTCPGTSLDKAGLIDASNYYLKWKVLRKGINGTDVLELQTLLGENGYPIKWKDGNFGVETDIAVRQFQKDKGLVVDGSVGEETMKMLRGESKPPIITDSGTKYYEKKGLYILENTVDKLVNEYVGGQIIKAGKNGINGGVFGDYSKSGIWHIAVQDGKLLGPNSFTSDYKKRWIRPVIIVGYDNSITIEYLYDILDNKRFKKLSDIKFAIGGFGNLTLPYLDLDYEKIPERDRNRTNRTAIAFKGNNIYLIAAKNMTYPELHKNVNLVIPNKDGGMALDGGGSSQMVYNKKEVFKSTDNRKVPNGLFFID